MVSDQDLHFSSHLSLYHNFLTGDGRRDAYWHFQAQESHILCVVDAIGSLQTELVSIGQNIGMGDAYYHLVFGAARRSKFIWGALRQLHSLISPSRDEPLPLDDAEEAARALNDIYIHLLGALDNYAWAIVYLFGDKSTRALHPGDIGLFARPFRRQSALEDFHSVTAPFQTWIREVRQRRDPVAHRIPLSVPPAFQNNETVLAYREVERKHADALRRYLGAVGEGISEGLDDLENEVDGYYSQLQKIGKFAPFIVHDPNEEMVRIYPTAPEDVGTFVLIARQQNRKILARLRIQ